MAVRVTVLGLALTAGCGRIAFDPLPDAALGTLAQQAYIKASNTEAGDLFGYSVALSGDGSTLAVGARLEDSGATSVDGNQADNSVMSAGAAYVLARAGASWTQEAYLKPSVVGVDDRFGVSVALAADGLTLAVGAYGTVAGGAVYIFVRAGGVWTQQAMLTAANPDPLDEFGYAIALSGDGNMLAIGANLEDSAATGSDGDQTDNSKADAGAAYVFTRAGTTWTQQAYLKASNPDAGDRFGVGVALSRDASTLAVGAFKEASGDGTQADNSAVGAGAVYVFTPAASSWTQTAYLKASSIGAGYTFGHFLALSADGATLAATADRDASAAVAAGAVYVFARTGAEWRQQAHLTAANAGAGDHLGSSIAISGDGATLVAGADAEASAVTDVNGDPTNDSAPMAGAAYVFSRTSTWRQLAYVKASNTDASDELGTSIALSSDASTLAVGAPNESGSGVGLTGNPADNSASNAGAVYVFR